MIIFPEKTAKQYGLEELRVGKHILRDKDRFRIDEVYISFIWSATVLSSFDDKASITTVHFAKHEFEGKAHSEEIKTCIMLGNFTTGPLNVREDIVASYFGNINLLPGNDYEFLDGIGYELTIDNGQLSSTLVIDNPVDKRLREIERSLFELANSICKMSPSSELDNYLNLWGKYLNR